MYRLLIPDVSIGFVAAYVACKIRRSCSVRQCPVLQFMRSLQLLHQQ